jgi:hypothetical protein
MSLSDLLDAATKIRDAMPGALEEFGAGASKALGSKDEKSAPKFWIRLDALGFPLSVTTEPPPDKLREGERDVFYKPA